MSLINALLQRRVTMEEGAVDDSALSKEGEAVDDSKIPSAGEDTSGVANADNGSPADDGGTADDATTAEPDDAATDDDTTGTDDGADVDPDAATTDEGTGEPSPDATVTDLPPTEDDLSDADPEAVAEQEAAEAEETIEDVEDDEAAVVAQADAVADLSQAQQSLEELAEQIAQTLPDGGMSPEMVATAQGAANDILEEVGEEAVGLPSQESFETVVGRRANTTIAMEAIGERAKEIGAKVWAWLIKMYDSLAEFLSTNAVRAKMIANAAAKAENVKLENGTFPVTVDLKGRTATSLRLTSSQAGMAYKTFVANLVTQRQRSYEGYLMLMAMSTAEGDNSKLDQALAEMERLGKNNPGFAMDPADAKAEFKLMARTDDELRTMAKAVGAAAFKFVENASSVRQQARAVKTALAKLQKSGAGPETTQKLTQAIKLANSELKLTFAGIAGAWAAYKALAHAASAKAEPAA